MRLAMRAGFVKTHMTKPLEEALAKLNPWIVDGKEGTIERFADLYTKLGKHATTEFEEVRRLLETIEIEFGQNLVGSSVWHDLVFKEVEALLAADQKVALSGVRNTKEIALLHMYGGVSVWLDRPSARPAKVSRGVKVLTPEDCDLIVVNDGTLGDLYVNLVVALEEYDSNKEKN